LNDTNDGLLGLREVADTLAVSEKTARRMVQRGALPAFLAGRKYRIRKEDLRAYIKESMRKLRAGYSPHRRAHAA